jgi:hypothetical protein
MSYTRTVYVGEYVKCKLKPGKWLHWMINERDEEEIRAQTKGRAGAADVAKLVGFHYIFPVFLAEKNKYHYIMLPGYTKLEDVGRCDTEIVAFEPTRTLSREQIVQDLNAVFDFAEVSFGYGACVEVW